MTTLPLTLDLAIAIGIYMLLAGLSGLRNQSRWAEILGEMRQRPGLTYLTGVVVYAIGVALILVHSVWIDPLAIVVTLFGWAAAIEGLILIFAPQPLIEFGGSLLRLGHVTTLAVFAIAAGAILIVLGVIGTAG